MRLADDARNCVVYLGYPDPAKPEEISVEGTGFIVSLGGKAGTYIVTAEHVAQKLENVPFGVRLNEKSTGKGRIEHVDRVKWYRHPNDDTVDAAVMVFRVPEWADVSPWPRQFFLSEQKREEKDIGAGDLVYVVGIFYLVQGRKKNLPAVHVGHVLLMPEDEPIPIKEWRQGYPAGTSVDVRGYLVEAAALPGSSGSPVFVRRSILREIVEIENDTRKIRERLKIWLHGTGWLLGLWHSAWFGDPAQIIAGPPGSKVPAGMGVVVPATRIIEILERSDLRKLRDDAEAADASARSATPLSSSSGVNGDESLRVMLNTPHKPLNKSKAKPTKRARGGVSSK